jgi:ubiquinone/menaquinone biosynthesis C-methylase UbiE
MSALTEKNWNDYVLHAEVIARSPGFGALRDRIIDLADVGAKDVVVDVGAGTGLLTLALAERAERVWAIDIAASMCEYLRTKAASAGLANVAVSQGTAASLPLVDRSVDVVVSNYCFHHLDEGGKRMALAEAYRVMRPGGRLVFGDMMFSLRPGGARDRQVIGAKVREMLRRGPAGAARLAKNGARIVTGRWEHPAPAGWWRDALSQVGFADVGVEELDHEGGVGFARRPPIAAPTATGR